MIENQPGKLKEITRHFHKADPVMFSVIAKVGLKPLEAERGPAVYFSKLCREIISQQLGSGAAHAILGRFLALFPRAKITPQRVFGYSEQELRATGMSWAKARYIKNLAERVLAGDIHFKDFPAVDDEAVIAELTKVKGIGRWTAEMFLIFTLGREDVFSYGDLGLRKGFAQLYGERQTRTQKSMEAIVRRWSPYRSYASLALWRLRDGEK